jgi:acetyl esterase/lipase
VRLPAASRTARPSAVDAATEAAGEAGLPLVLFLHGGFWRAAYDRAHTGPLSETLAAEGFAVCAPEYRRVGQPGGGWPGTLDDVAAAVDRLPVIVAEAAGGRVNAGQFLLAGHSAGGHLALWAAARHRLPPDSPWRPPQSARCPAVRGVVGLGAVCDLAACFEQDLGSGAAADLMGGSPSRHPDRYRAADPAGLLPVGAAVRLVHGAADGVVPCEMSRAYAAQARSAGDDAACRVLPGFGHFEVIDPLTAAWPEVLAAVRRALLGAGAAGADPGRP